jgi:hypothetical protein
VRLTWQKNIFAKRKQLGITITKMHWLLGRKSKLSKSNKLLCKTIFKPIWTYGMQLWGMASTSNKEILECFQLKALSMTVDAPWYVSDTVMQGISNYQHLRKKSAATALNTVLTSAHTKMF